MIPPFTLMNLAFMKSDTGRDGWEPVMPEAVPAWLKEPDVLAQLVVGEMAMDAASDDPCWWRVVQLETPQ